MKRLRRKLAALTLGAALLTSTAQGVSLTLDNKPLDLGDTPVYNGTTYVSLRLLAEVVWPGAQVSWGNGRASVLHGDTTLQAQPGERALLHNGEETSLNMPVRLENGRTLVPVRPFARLLGLDVSWNGTAGEVSLTTRSAGGENWSQEDLYWLSRIISAESRGECREGKIAVGNVVLNRVASPEFPDTIYDVIFDDRWGGQFEPVRNGTVYDEPTQESVEAARACLEGENTVGDSLYFLAPTLTSNHWTMENRTYVTTIGVHWFYE